MRRLNHVNMSAGRGHDIVNFIQCHITERFSSHSSHLISKGALSQKKNAANAAVFYCHCGNCDNERLKVE